MGNTQTSLTTALENLEDLIADAKEAEFPLTNEHIEEIRFKAVSFANNLDGDSHNRYMATLEYGMKVVAGVQQRNSRTILQEVKDGIVLAGVEGVVASNVTPRWKHEENSLEYALSSYGNKVVRTGAGRFKVVPKTTKEFCLHSLASKLQDENRFELDKHTRTNAKHAYAGTRFQENFNNNVVVVNKDDCLQILSLASGTPLYNELLDCLV